MIHQELLDGDDNPEDVQKANHRAAELFKSHAEFLVAFKTSLAKKPIPDTITDFVEKCKAQVAQHLDRCATLSQQVVDPLAAKLSESCKDMEATIKEDKHLVDFAAALGERFQ